MGKVNFRDLANTAAGMQLENELIAANAGILQPTKQATESAEAADRLAVTYQPIGESTQQLEDSAAIATPKNPTRRRPTPKSVTSKEPQPTAPAIEPAERKTVTFSVVIKESLNEHLTANYSRLGYRSRNDFIGAILEGYFVGSKEGSND